MIARVLSMGGWKIFSWIVVFNVLILIASQIVLIDEIVFFNTYSEQLTYERSMELFDTMRSYSWVTYAMTPILLLLKFSVLSVLLYVGVFFSDLTKEITLGKIFKVVVMCEIVFVVASVIKLLWFVFFAGNYTLEDLSYFYPLSLINLFSRSEVASYWVYPLQILNVFQVLYALLLAIGLSTTGLVRKSTADRVVLLTYFPAIVVWVATIMFLTIDAMP